MLRLLRTEQSRCDVWGCLGSSISTHVIQECAAEQLEIHFGTRLLLVFAFSSLLERGSEMDTKALCGCKGRLIVKANLSAGGSGNGRYRMSLPGCASGCL